VGYVREEVLEGFFAAFWGRRGAVEKRN